MGLLQRAVETYNTHEALAGKVEEGKTPLAPVGHTVTSAQVEIVLNRRGECIDAHCVDEKIIIPVTEASAGRSSGQQAHPLCDRLDYLSPCDPGKRDLYLTQLDEWRKSKYGNEKLDAIYTYVSSGMILRDLAQHGIIELNADGTPKKPKLFISWAVGGDSSDVDVGEKSKCCRDKVLMDAFAAWYREKRAGDEKVFCMLSGQKDVPALQHAKGIVPLNGNAKLISANDASGFTYRGRFVSADEAMTVGYEASQKAHNALRWLIANQGCYFGGRQFLCWNPGGHRVPALTGPFRRKTGVKVTPSDYRDSLKEALAGYAVDLPDNENVVIAVFDAATKGRLAAVYYNELVGSDFLRRLKDWESECCWWDGPFGIQSPLLFNIVRYAFGSPAEENGKTTFVVSDAVMRLQMQRLMSCRIDRARIPTDIVKGLVERATRSAVYDKDTMHNIIHTTCAVLNKYHFDKEGEDVMGWELDHKDRSYQFGRLLAVMDRVEQDYYHRTGESRQTNALKAMSAFRQHPLRTYEQINRQITTAYLPRVNEWARTRYRRLVGEIMDILSTFPADEMDKPLGDTYILGFDMQNNEFFRKNKNNDNMEDKNEHPEE